MTNDEIYMLAYKAGLIGFLPKQGIYWIEGHEPGQELERFADLVASAEREACAKVCDENWRYTANASEMAEYIRARGQA